MGRRAIWPDFSGYSTGRFLMPCMPRMADWGGLRMGVDIRLPKTPPLVMVKVPPVISESSSVPALARVPKSLMPDSTSAKLMVSQLRSTGTTRPLGPATAMAMSL